MRASGQLVGALAIWLVAVSGSATARAGCDGAAGASGTVDLMVGSTKRLFLLRLPSVYDARTPRPVVFVFHGFTMNAHLIESWIDVAPDWPEAIVVYPQGLPRQFETMPVGAQPGWQVSSQELGDRDLQFFDGMLEWLRKNQCVDEKRIYAIGYSNGAFFSHLLACERPGVLAGIATAGGGLTCTPTRPQAVILSHGLRDPLVKYEQAVAAARAWADRNGCGQPPKNGAAGCSKAESCKDAPVVLCTVPGGHDYDRSFTRKAVEFLKAFKPAKPGGDR